MEMEEKRVPGSHECLRQETSNSWSELPPDLLNSVFERIGFADFQRAKSVCSSWHSASRQSVPKNQIPWLIIFPEDSNNNNNSCTLFNPEEKDKLYQTQDLGVEFTKSVCLATYGSWLLMHDPCYNLYILNLFSHERINLPPVESQLGMTKIERTLDDGFRILSHREIYESKGIYIQSPVFSIDDKTKDYVVIWGLVRGCVVYSKKGDNFWNQVPEISLPYHMIYKDHKLYFISCSNLLTILDFSGQIPQQTFQCHFKVPKFKLGRRLRPGQQMTNSWRGREAKVVVTLSGDILRVKRRVRPRSNMESFRVYKIYSSGVYSRKKLVVSLGDESILLDLGITVLANDTNGFNRNSIYFSDSDDENTNDIFLFNLETQKMELLRSFDCSPAQLSESRWFLPSFMQTDD